MNFIVLAGKLAPRKILANCVDLGVGECGNNQSIVDKLESFNVIGVVEEDEGLILVDMYFFEVVFLESIPDVLLGDVGGEVGEFDGFLRHNYKVRDYRWGRQKYG